MLIEMNDFFQFKHHHYNYKDSSIQIRAIDEPIELKVQNAHDS